MLTLARDEHEGARAVEALRRLERAEDLLELARDERVEARVRRKAAEAGAQLGRVENATSILLTLARDWRVDVWVRVDAAKALGRYGDTSILLDLDQLAKTDPSRSVRDAAREAADMISRRLSNQLS